MATTTLKKITPADIGAVAKSGDTMTGGLTAPSISVKANLPMYYLRDENNLDYAHMRGDNTDHHIIFRMTTPGGSPQLFEDYNLPNPTIQSGPAGYFILTTKSPVTVPQGGTGATTFEGARNNLGIYPFHFNVDIDSNGQGFINFSSVGLSSRPNVCFMEIVNVGSTIVRYNFDASTSQIVLEPVWLNGNAITNTTIAVQGIAFA